MERGVVVNWGGHFMVREKKGCLGNVPGGARRCPEVPGGAPPGKTGAKKIGLFTAVGSTFPTRGVLKILEGKGVCPEVPGGARRCPEVPGGARRFAQRGGHAEIGHPQSKKHPQKKTSKYFWPILPCPRPLQAPQKHPEGKFSH